VSSQLRYGDESESADAAAELDELGFSALWIPDVGGPVFDAVGHLLAATKRSVIATGILNLWMHSAGDVAESYAALTAEYGTASCSGSGQPRAADRRWSARAIPQTTGGDGVIPGWVGCAQRPVPTQRRVLAALGPKMLALSASRAAGAHPYLVTPEHTASARANLGEGPLLLPEQTVILCDDADTARRIGTDWLRAYLRCGTTQ